MLASQTGAAHAYAMIDVDYSAVDRVRRAVGATWKQEFGYSLSYLAFVTRAIVIAVGKYPKLNSQFGEAGLSVRREIALGIAVDLNFDGLVVPVIQRANELKVPELARAIHDLADRARNGKLTNDDVAGGSFTVSNPGPFGARITLPIINQPQVAIVTVDAIAPRPAVIADADGAPRVGIRPIGNLTLAWDHRAFDGAYAASALEASRVTLESHDWRTEFDASWFSAGESSAA
jgi:2-oxoglutarate dehydrogenase E2 component (dihydrolipoamide succinyltransferase)